MDDVGSRPLTHSVGEVARTAAVSIRTLHHYDAIGLLCPRGRTPSGYRVYDGDDIARLQRILSYRALGFGLDEISLLLDKESDPMLHLRRQRELLTSRIQLLQRMLGCILKTMEAHEMGIQLTPEERLEVFGDHDLTEYAEEVRERWSETDAYRQSHQKTSGYTKDDWLQAKAEADLAVTELAAAFAAGEPAAGAVAMHAAEMHRRHISRWYYDCTLDIHRGLADMYLADPRFAENYEDIASGLTGYIHDAIHANAERRAGGDLS